jgi:hypothetical protein
MESNLGYCNSWYYQCLEQGGRRSCHTQPATHRCQVVRTTAAFAALPGLPRVSRSCSPTFVPLALAPLTLPALSSVCFRFALSQKIELYVPTKRLAKWMLN